MSNKLIDLIIKYNELTPKEKKLFAEVIGIEIKEVPVISPRSIDDLIKPKKPEPYNPLYPHIPIPDINPYRTPIVYDILSKNSAPCSPLDVTLLKGDNTT